MRQSYDFFLTTQKLFAEKFDGKSASFPHSTARRKRFCAAHSPALNRKFGDIVK